MDGVNNSLGTLLERIKLRNRDHLSQFFILSASGKRLSREMLRIRWQEARESAQGGLGDHRFGRCQLASGALEGRHYRARLPPSRRNRQALEVGKFRNSWLSAPQRKSPADVNLRGFQIWRPRSESNRRRRICNPEHNHFATRPQMSEAAIAASNSLQLFVI